MHSTGKGRARKRPIDFKSIEQSYYTGRTIERKGEEEKGIRKGGKGQ